MAADHSPCRDSCVRVLTTTPDIHDCLISGQTPLNNPEKRSLPATNLRGLLFKFQKELKGNWTGLKQPSLKRGVARLW